MLHCSHETIGDLWLILIVRGPLEQVPCVEDEPQDLRYKSMGKQLLRKLVCLALNSHAFTLPVLRVSRCEATASASLSAADWSQKRLVSGFTIYIRSGGSRMARFRKYIRVP